MQLRPLAGYVLVEPIKEEQTTASGMVLPDAPADKPSKGKLLAIGEPLNEEDEKKAKGIKIGDNVQHHKWAGQDVKEGQKEYRLVKFSDLMGRYEEDRQKIEPPPTYIDSDGNVTNYG